MTDYEIIKHITAARAANLSGRYLLDDVDAVQRDCNGIGPCWFPAWLRRRIDSLLAPFVTASWIHDRRYVIGGTFWTRMAADLEFFDNCIRMAFHLYPWHDLRLYVKAATALFIALLIGGGTAFNYINKE